MRPITAALFAIAVLSWLAAPRLGAETLGDAGLGSHAVAAASRPALFLQAKALYDLALQNGTVPTLGPAAPWVARVATRLDQRVDIAFDQAAFDQVIAWLRAAAGVTIVVDPALVHIPRVSITQQGITIGNALKQVLAEAGLQMMLQDQAVFISDHHREVSDLRLYDVDRLMQRMRTLGVGGAPITAERLVAFITATVEPASWSAGTTGLELRHGSTLFAIATPSVHERLSLLLVLLADRAQAAAAAAAPGSR